MVKESAIEITTLSRQQMKAELLGLPKGVAGMVWHVGSDPDKNSFNSVIVHEAQRSGFVSWIQGTGILESMNIQPYYFPQLGLDYQQSSGKIVLNPALVNDLEEALSADKGIDFHPDSAPGWQQVIQRKANLGRIRLLKTQLVSPNCSQGVLSTELLPYQPFIYGALVKGHLNQAKMLSPSIVISIDDPTPFSVETFRESLSVMLGDKFEAGTLATTELETLRAVHCCGDYDVLGVMATRAVDVVHWDAWKYGVAPLIGRAKILRDFVDDSGLFVWGGIPQNLHYLQDLGKQIGIAVEIAGRDDYEKLADGLMKNKEQALDLVLANYLHWSNRVSQELNADKSFMARRTFISATCGYGSNNIASLRNFAYDLSRQISDRNKEIAG